MTLAVLIPTENPVHHITHAATGCARMCASSLSHGLMTTVLLLHGCVVLVALCGLFVCRRGH